MMGEIVADGSSVEDARTRVEIDRSKPSHKWRFTCPEGCSNWVRTNNHILCRSCQEADEHGVKNVDVEYHYILDKKRNERIPWSAVEVVE